MKTIILILSLFLCIGNIEGNTKHVPTENNTIESWGTWTERMTLVQGFGYSSYHYKILLRDSKGREYFVWYYSKLEASNGSTIVVTLRQDCSSCDLYFKKLTNTKNGRESDVYSWLKA